MSSIQKVRAGVSVMIDVMVPMRDGVDLSADVYLPPGDGPFPTLLCRTTYGKQSGEICTDLAYLQEWVPRFLEGGYAAVMQDCRGRYDSVATSFPTSTRPPTGRHAGMAGLPALVRRQHRDVRAVLRGLHPTAGGPVRPPLAQGILPVGNQEDNFGYFLWTAESSSCRISCGVSTAVGGL